MNRIMLDLETLGTSAGCVVATIGAVRFTPHEILDSIYLRLDIRQQQRDGLHIDADTVLWWLKRDEAARAELTAGDVQRPTQALTALADWMRSAGQVDELWGNGADFDCVILAAMYRQLLSGAFLPWRYSAHRCFRTMAALYPQVQMEREGTHHNALDDAISQAKHLQRIWPLSA